MTTAAVSLTDFFRNVLPSTGRYLLRSLPKGRNQFYNTIPELVHAAEQRREQTGQYFTVASLGEEDNGTGANVVALRCHRLDIDAGEAKFHRDPDGAYPNKREALAACGDFIKTTMLRPTYVVSSGEGFHLYFCLTGDVTPDEWTPVAQMLKQTCKALEFKADPTCTADAARILRIPGAMHNNGNRVAILRATSSFYTNDEFRESLARFAPKGTSIDDILPRRAKSAVVAGRDINADITYHDERPASLERVAAKCAAVAQLKDTHGNLPEPHWRAVIGIAKFCPEDGELLAHEWSSGHPSYSYDETQQKLDSWTTGPSTCRHFDALTKACETCPHRGQITSPITLGRQSVTTIAAAPPIPMVQVADLTELAAIQSTKDQPIPARKDLFKEDSPFFFRKNDAGGWHLWHGTKIKEQDDDGDDVFRIVHRPVANRIFYVDYVTSAGEDGEEGVQLKVIVVDNNMHRRAYRLPAGLLADAKKVVVELLNWGVVVDGSNNTAADSAKKYLLMEYQRMSERMRPVSRGRFGFQQHEGQTICTIGTSAIFPDGHIEYAMYGHTLAGVGDSLCVRGLPANDTGFWPADVLPKVLVPNAQVMTKHLADGYSGPANATARLALAIGLAGPIMSMTQEAQYIDQRMLPANGMVVSLYSAGSGKGKTAVMQTIALAYGDISQVRGGARQNMTAVAGDSLAKVTGMFPFLLDEVTQNEAQDVGDTIYRFANGRSRVRATIDGGVQQQATWSLPCLLSTNVPQRELLAVAQRSGVAQDMRLLELNFDDAPLREYNETWTTNLRALTEVAGCWGAVFMARLVADMNKARAISAANVTKSYALLDKDMTWRYFARSLATVLTMFDYMADLIPFDREEIIASYVEAVADLAESIPNTNSPTGTFNDFVNSMGEHIAVTNSMGDNSVVENMSKLRAPLYGRYVRNDQTLWISPKALAKYCQEMKLSKAQLEKDWIAAGLLVPNGSTRTWTVNPFRGLPIVARATAVYRCNMHTDSATGTNVVSLPVSPTAAKATEVKGSSYAPNKIG